MKPFKSFVQNLTEAVAFGDYQKALKKHDKAIKVATKEYQALRKQHFTKKSVEVAVRYWKDLAKLVAEFVLVRVANDNDDIVYRANEILKSVQNDSRVPNDEAETLDQIVKDIRQSASKIRAAYTDFEGENFTRHGSQTYKSLMSRLSDISIFGGKRSDKLIVAAYKEAGKPLPDFKAVMAKIRNDIEKAYRTKKINGTEYRQLLFTYDDISGVRSPFTNRPSPREGQPKKLREAIDYTVGGSVSRQWHENSFDDFKLATMKLTNWVRDGKVDSEEAEKILAEMITQIEKKISGHPDLRRKFPQAIAKMKRANGDRHKILRISQKVGTIDFNSLVKRVGEAMAAIEELKKAEMVEALDPVGQEDDDIDNDGDVDAADSYLKHRRKVRTKAIKGELEEAFVAGEVKLEDGSRVKITKDEAKAIEGMLKGLIPALRKKAERDMLSSKKSFEEFLKTAKNMGGAGWERQNPFERYR